MIIKVNDVITLSDHKKFVVLSETIYNDYKYYYLIEVSGNAEEITNNIKIVKKLNNKDDSKLINVINLDEIDKVKEELVKNFEENELI